MIQRYSQLWLFRKKSGNSFSTTFWVSFFKKKFSHVKFYWLTIFYCLIVFTVWDIGQYVYCNRLLPRLRRHKFCKLTLSFLSSRFSTRPKIQDKHLNILRTKRAFKVKLKAFLKSFQLLKVNADLRVRL